MIHRRCYPEGIMRPCRWMVLTPWHHLWGRDAGIGLSHRCVCTGAALVCHAVWFGTDRSLIAVIPETNGIMLQPKTAALIEDMMVSCFGKIKRWMKMMNKDAKSSPWLIGWVRKGLQIRYGVSAWLLFFFPPTCISVLGFLFFFSGETEKAGDKTTMTRQCQVWMQGWLEI